MAALVTSNSNLFSNLPFSFHPPIVHIYIPPNLFWFFMPFSFVFDFLFCFVFFNKLTSVKYRLLFFFFFFFFFFFVIQETCLAWKIQIHISDRKMVMGVHRMAYCIVKMSFWKHGVKYAGKILVIFEFNWTNNTTILDNDLSSFFYSVNNNFVQTLQQQWHYFYWAYPIIIIITSLFKEGNIFSARTNLTYGPHKYC